MTYLHCICVGSSHDDVTVYGGEHQMIILLYMFRSIRSCTVNERAHQMKRCM